MYVKFDTYCYLKQTQNKINSIASKSLQNITIFTQSVLVGVAALYTPWNEVLLPYNAKISSFKKYIRYSRNYYILSKLSL
jgi:hypothetical protein